MQNLILTGGSGLLALNWAFFKKDETRISLLLHQKNISMEGVDSVFLNLNSYNAVYEFLSKKESPVVVHCAALTSIDYCEKNPQAAHETNVVISEKLAHVCHNLGIKFIHISSDHLFSGDHSFSTEDSEISPLNVYGASKATAEERVLKKNPESLIIRTNFFCWGTSYRSSFSDFLIDAIRQKTKIYLYTDVFYTPIYAKYLIEFVHILIATSSKGIYNIVGSERISKYEFGKMIFNNFSGDINLITKVKYSKQEHLVDRPLDMSLSNQKLIEFINISSENLEVQIKQLKLDEIFFKKAINYL